MKRRVIIIGGGAAGLAAAVQAAGAGAAVLILEQMARPGKKLLSTGNGKCNLTNLRMPPEAYRGENPSYAPEVISRFTVADTLDFFEGLGILTMDRNGYVYPNSGQASSVLEALLLEAEHLGAEVACGWRVEEVLPEGDSFVVKAVSREEQREFQGSAVILASGSRAAPGTGSDGSGYFLAKRLGHRIIKPLPALVQLRCAQMAHGRQWSGVRTEACVELLVEGRRTAADRGELQLTDYGISGIPVFQVSRYAAVALDRGQAVRARIDFLPSMPEEELRQYLEIRQKRIGYRGVVEFLNGLLNRKLSQVLLKQSKIRLEETAASLEKSQIAALLKNIKRYETKITATNSYENAQVCCGGVDTEEVDPATMESRLVKGFYLAGEILDVDGICGGYNLQWAWSSGSVAGISAGKRCGGELLPSGPAAGRRSGNTGSGRRKHHDTH